MSSYYAELGAAKTAAKKTTTVKLHPTVKLNVAAVQAQQAAEAALAAAQSKARMIFIALGLAAAGGAWWFMKKRKAK